MKVVYVVDSITDINKKIGLLTNKFGDNLSFVVRADLVQLFQTYGHSVHAIYYTNLTKVIHSLLMKSELEDVVIYYSSLMLDNNLLTKFTNSIGNKAKMVGILPKYNACEQLCNSAYNVYVKSMFKLKDSLITPKLQFIPSHLLMELLQSHMGNRLFDFPSEVTTKISVENKEINKSMKVKINPLKHCLISLIIALVLTIGLLASIAYLKVNFLVILMFIVLYISDLILTIVFLCKNKFDLRFLK